VVDSGDLLFDAPRVPDNRLDWAKERASLIVRAYNETGCAAFNVGERDLAAGLDTLQALRKEAKFPFVSANLLDGKGKPLFAPYVVAEAAGTKIGFVGLASPKEPTLARPADGSALPFTVGDPVDAAKTAVAGAKKSGARFVVLLSQLRPDELTAVLAAAPEIEVVLGSALPQNQPYLSVVGDDVQALSYTKGKYLGVLTLHVQAGGGGEVVYRERGDALVREIRTLDGRIRGQERQWQQMAQQPASQTQRLESYQRTVAQLVAERATLVKSLGEVASVDPKASFVGFELIALGRDKTEDEQIKALVDAFKAKTPEPQAQGYPPALKSRVLGGAEPLKKPADARLVAPLKARPPKDMPPPVRRELPPKSEAQP
jgi:2',3'-cyclic-nucleotide 2'-phosphodiesterase (5'-nucleotidase family)